MKRWAWWRKPKRYIRMTLATGEFVIIGGDVEPEREAAILFAFAPDADWQGIRDGFIEKYEWTTRDQS